jgi:hypothetical protein
VLKDEFLLEVFQQRIVDAENIFEPTVRDPLVALEQRHHSWEERMESALGISRV